MDVLKITPRQTRNCVSIDAELCKGCGLCVENCPKNVLQLGDAINSQGYKAVVASDSACSGCGNCFYICPEPAAISISRDVPVAPAQPEKRRAA